MFRIKYSREVALKLLYQIDVLGQEKEETASQLLQKNIDFFKGLNEREKKFVIDIVQIVMENKEKIDQLISGNLIGWKLERLVFMDRNLLRMGIAESTFNDQKAIIIDDIVRIAKKYSGEDSFKIINAILDKVIQ
jgi:N utilization substance protein B